MVTAEGFTAALLFAAAVTWIGGYMLSRFYVSIGAAVILSTCKTIICLAYFSYFNYGQWYMRDDVNYFLLSMTMKRHGYTALNTLFGFSDLEPMRTVVGSEHTLYYWWNILAFQLFGEYYYAPVFLNILLTFLCGVMLCKILSEQGFLPKYTQRFYIFFLLHWDILSWSSFVNLKDVLVLTLSVLSYYCMFRLLRKFEIASCIGAATSLYLLISIRHYVPIFLVLSVGIWVFLNSSDRRKYFFLVLLFGAVLFLKPWETKYMNYFRLQSPIFSAIRFLLMPQFWTVIQPNEGFIEVPALLHWIMFIPMFMGAYSLWRLVPVLRIPMIYFVLMTGFYVMVPELQGMRQRFQLAFIMSLCQFHILWLFLKAGAFKIDSLPSSRNFPAP